MTIEPLLNFHNETVIADVWRVRYIELESAGLRKFCLDRPQSLPKHETTV